MREIWQSWRRLRSRSSNRTPVETSSNTQPHQKNGRRRISVSVISNQTQEKRKRDLRRQGAHGGSSSKKAFSASQSQSQGSESSCLGMIKDDRDSMDDRPLVHLGETTPEASGAQTPPDSCPIPNSEDPAPKQVVIKKIQNKKYSKIDLQTS
ncbi:hypothetical protein LDENG_00071590 [Lucifuga dentata]|nr:hypothetical protein LDENG_00071590 [Lucifuga dentata]